MADPINVIIIFNVQNKFSNILSIIERKATGRKWFTAEAFETFVMGIILLTFTIGQSSIIIQSSSQM